MTSKLTNAAACRERQRCGRIGPSPLRLYWQQQCAYKALTHKAGSTPNTIFPVEASAA